MRRTTLLAVGFAVAMVGGGCRGDVLGQPCEVDEQCGSGYDCYPDVCVRVCTRDEECHEGAVCYRYHCLSPDAVGDTGRTPGQPAARAPPVPDANTAELRAIRYELERLRQDVGRLLEAQGLPPQAPPPAMPVPDVPAE